MRATGRTIEPIRDETRQAVSEIVDSALAVHRALGPGLLESVYKACLCHELASRNIPFRRQVPFPISYRGMLVEAGLRIDLLVAEQVVVELKAVEQHHPLFEAQLLTYLKLTGHRLGLLINFNVPLLKDRLKQLAL